VTSVTGQQSNTTKYYKVYILLSLRFIIFMFVNFQCLVQYINLQVNKNYICLIHKYTARFWSHTNKFDTTPITYNVFIEFEHIHTQVNKMTPGVHFSIQI